MVRCLATFLNFCYLVQCNAICAYILNQITEALDHFHNYHKIFIETGVRINNISLPRQHSLVHYINSIILFGSSNSLCSSITELKHIKAVKKPWCWSQMLLTNVHQDKLAAAWSVFTQKGMMQGSTLVYMMLVMHGKYPLPLPTINEERHDDHGAVTGPWVMNTVKLTACPGESLASLWCQTYADHCVKWYIIIECKYPKFLPELASYIDQPQLPELVRCFLFEQFNIDLDLDPMFIPLTDCPQFSGHIHAYHSAITRFYTPSDLCGVGGMYHELICSNPLWHQDGAHCDTIFVTADTDHDGFWGMCVTRVYLFFSFVYEGADYHCALVHWFVPVGDSVHEETGQWVVAPESVGKHCNRHKHLTVIHVDCIARGALLSPVYGSGYLPDNFHFSISLDAFHTYFVNNYADHHMHEFVPKFN